MRNILAVSLILLASACASQAPSESSRQLSSTPRACTMPEIQSVYKQIADMAAKGIPEAKRLGTSLASNRGSAGCTFEENSAGAEVVLRTNELTSHITLVNGAISKIDNK